MTREASRQEGGGVVTAAAQPDDETVGIRTHICFAAHGIKNCGETDPEWCRCYRSPGHHGEHRCACGHRWVAS